MASGIFSLAPSRPVVASIAGFDPSAGAGVAADLKVFAAQGFFGMACITALTVQSTRGVRSVEPVAAPIVAATLQALAEDVDFAGIKIGMLATAEICRVVADFLDALQGVPVVLDPVLRSTSGRELLESAGLPTFRQRLLPRAAWVTPNLEELAALTESRVENRDEIPGAAEKLRQLARDFGGPGLNVLVTGGHLDRPDDYLLTSSGETAWIHGERVETNATHGTGCALSSALLCQVAAGDSALAAANHAKAYVASALRAAYPIGHGKGPMNHLFALEKTAPRG